MDTILVVNAGSSSVKFQVFAVEGDGRLRRQIKGQMDGIGSRPRLRASDATGDTVADRAYPVESGRRRSRRHGGRRRLAAVNFRSTRLRSAIASCMAGRITPGRC